MDRQRQVMVGVGETRFADAAIVIFLVPYFHMFCHDFVAFRM